MNRHFPKPVINTIGVESLDEAIARVEKAEGASIHGPNEVPGIGLQAYGTNMEDNIFGLHEPLAK